MDSGETTRARGGGGAKGRRSRTRRVSMRTRGAFASMGDPRNLRRSRRRRNKVLIFWALAVALSVVLAAALHWALRGPRQVRDRVSDALPREPLPTLLDPMPTDGRR